MEIMSGQLKKTHSERRCVSCGKVLKGNRKRKHCNNACKQSSYRVRLILAAIKS
jgi:hypothetical protein